MTTLSRLYTRVLVPLDGSVAAEFAIRFARDLASRHQAELLLLHLHTVDVLTEDSDTSPTDDHAAYLERLRKELQPADGLSIQTHTLASSNLRKALFEFIDNENVSVVVLSTRGRTPMLNWLFGSTLETTLDAFPVPLMLVRPRYQNVIVPLDGSKWSESAIPRAVEIARVHDAELILLHIYQAKGSDYASDWALAGQQHIAEQTLDQVREQLISLRNRLRQEGINAREALVRGNNPAQNICDFVASEDGISAIVMSTHGRTGISRWLMGSVAQNVIKNTRAAVILVNPDQ